MQKLLFLLLGSLLMNMASAQIDQGLKGYWPFSGGSLADESGNGNDGMMVEIVQPTTDRYGHAECAMYFPGGLISSYIHIAYSEDFNIAPDGALSISLWYQGGSEAVGDQEWLFRKSDDAGGAGPQNYGLGLFDMNRAIFADGTWGGTLWSTVAPPIPDPAWHHLVAVYDGGAAKLYLDNAEVASTGTDGLTTSQSTGHVNIGMNFQGAIDDVRFYDRALSMADVGLLFNESSACASGTEEHMASTGFTVSPNPASHILELTLAATGGPHQVRLHDATGRLLLERSVTGDKLRLDASEFPSGLYFVQVETDGALHTERVVIE